MVFSMTWCSEIWVEFGQHRQDSQSFWGAIGHRNSKGGVAVRTTHSVHFQGGQMVPYCHLDLGLLSSYQQLAGVHCMEQKLYNYN